MRTTVNIDEQLLRRAKERAHATSQPLGAVLDDALRVLLTKRAPTPGGRVRVPVHGGSGLRPGVDLEDTDALAALLGEDAAGAGEHAAG